MGRARIAIVTAALSAIWACDGGAPGSPSSQTATLQSVTIEVPVVSLVVGQAAPVRASGRYSDGSVRDVQFTAAWSSSNPSVLAVSTTGVVTAMAVGSADIVATVSGVQGRRSMSGVPPGSDDQQFRVAIMLTTATRPLESDVMRVFAKANDILRQLTGQRMTRVDYFDAGPGSTSALAQDYVRGLPGALPDGVLALSDDATSTTFGGYSTTFLLPSPHLNRFPSPSSGNRAYLAVVDFVHKYGRCGYDDAGNRISGQSGGGECRNQSGLQCVDNGRFWQCPNTLTDLYSEPDRFTACSIVHEFVHPFGSAGNFDHYGTLECVARTHIPPFTGDVRPSQESCGLCPDLYYRFRPR